ncbi:RNA-directed DNA polymerase from mobile element jockey [Trichonephila clavipes]|nr:RNA-directed DNA polymerase from mobile element jockey [Trichonephila clavipes]
MADQKVCQLRRITIRRDGQVLNTKYLILTFATPDLPQSVKAAYLHCFVRPYIPNPLRCFQFQRFLRPPAETNQHALAALKLVLKALIAKLERKAWRIVSSRMPVSGKSYAAATTKTTMTTASQTHPVNN